VNVARRLDNRLTAAEVIENGLGHDEPAQSRPTPGKRGIYIGQRYDTFGDR